MINSNSDGTVSDNDKFDLRQSFFDLELDDSSDNESNKKAQSLAQCDWNY